MSIQTAWVESICESIRTEPERWRDSHGNVWRDGNVEIRLGGIPILSVKVFARQTINLSLVNKFRLYKTIREADVHFRS